MIRSSKSFGAFFHGANGIKIDGGTFNEVHGNFTHFEDHRTIVNQAELGEQFSSLKFYSTTFVDEREGWNALSNAIASGAIHNADERSSAAKCHPDTRTEVLSMMKTWIKNPNSESGIMWMHGPTGVGKTAIAQSIAEWAHAERILGGSFFFLRGSPEQEEARYLFPTIAYQLALRIPGMREYINNIMSIDPTLPSKDLETQLELLIIESFKTLSPLFQPPLLVVIDAIDECRIPAMQEGIIRHIGRLVGTFHIPLRFLISTRSEAHIREVFDLPDFSHITRRIVLDKQFEPDNDIRTVLTCGFSRILTRMEITTETALWPPSPDVIDILVTRSSGQFIYATTVLDFIGAEWHMPDQQLDIVLNPSPAHTNLFENLDALYTQILERCPYRIDLVRTFSLMLCLHCPQPPEVYDDLLGFARGHTTRLLRGMHSLVKFPDATEDANERIRLNQNQEYDVTCGLRLHHTSFADFLVDQNRSKGFFVDPSAMHSDLAKAGFQLLRDCVAEPWRETPRSIFPRYETWGYLKNHLTIHISLCDETAKAAAIQELEDFKPDFSLAKPFQDVSWNLAFDALHALVTILMKTIAHHDGSHPPTPSFPHSEHSHWTHDVTFESIVPFDRDSVSDKASLKLALRYCKVLDEFYVFALSKSQDLINLLTRLPGFAISNEPFIIDCLEDIFGVCQGSVLADMDMNRRFLHRWDSLEWDHVSNIAISVEVVAINPHMYNFLSDPSRSQNHYQQPTNSHINACRNLVKVVRSPKWVQIEKKDGALSCLERMLKLHLDTVNVDPSTDYPDDHPLILLIVDFAGIICNMSYLETAPLANVKLVWSATRRIIDWIQRQKSKISNTDKGPISQRLEALFMRSNNEIYLRMLALEFSEDGKTQTITLCEPFLTCVDPRRSTSMPTPSGKDMGNLGGGTDTVRVSPHSTRISEALLALHALRHSLLAFLTQEACAGPFYIPAGVYHTQFAEICLDHCDPLMSDITGNWRVLPAHTEWSFHLGRAQPSARLLTQLQQLGTGRWLAGGAPHGANLKEIHVKSIMGIIQWLEVSRGTSDLRDRWSDMLRDIEGIEQRRPLVRRRPRISF